MSDAVLHAAPGESASRTAWAMPLIPVAVSGFLLSAMTSLRVQGDLPSPPEGTLAGGVVALYRLFGFEPLFMVCVLTLTWSSIWFLTGRVERPLSRLARIGALGLSLAILVNLRVDGVLPSGGGELGALLASRLASVVSPAISIFAVAVAAVAALLLATDFFFYGHFERLGARRLGARDLGTPAPEVDEVDAVEQEELESLELGAPHLAAPPFEPVEVTQPDAGPDPEPDPEPEQASEGDEMGDLGPQSQEEEVWAIEEGLSSVTLLGPRLQEIEDLEHVVDAAGAAAVDGETPASAGNDAAADPVVDPMGDESFVDAPNETVVVSAGPSEDDPSLGDEAQADVERTEGTPFGEPSEDHADTRAESEPVDTASSETPLVSGAAVGDEEPAGAQISEQPAPAAGAEPVVELTPAPRVVPQPAGPAIDAELVEEAVELVVAHRRASANFLKRRLRVEDDEAIALLQLLAQRGIIDCELGATQGRVRSG